MKVRIADRLSELFYDTSHCQNLCDCCLIWPETILIAPKFKL